MITNLQPLREPKQFFQKRKKKEKKHHKQEGFLFYANDDRQCLTDLSGILNKNTNSPVFFPEQFNMMRVREIFN